MAVTFMDIRLMGPRSCEISFLLVIDSAWFGRGRGYWAHLAYP